VVPGRRLRVRETDDAEAGGSACVVGQLYPHPWPPPQDLAHSQAHERHGAGGDDDGESSHKELALDRRTRCRSQVGCSSGGPGSLVGAKANQVQEAPDR